MSLRAGSVGKVDERGFDGVPTGSGLEVGDEGQVGQAGDEDKIDDKAMMKVERPITRISDELKDPVENNADRPDENDDDLDGELKRVDTDEPGHLSLMRTRSLGLDRPGETNRTVGNLAGPTDRVDVGGDEVEAEPMEEEPEEVTPEPIDQDQVGRLVDVEVEVRVDEAVARMTGTREDDLGKESGGVVKAEKGDDEVTSAKDEMEIGHSPAGAVVKEERIGEGAARDSPMNADMTKREERETSESRGRREEEERERKAQKEEEEKVDMDRLLNSIEITKRATFLRQRLSSVGRRPPGETFGASLFSASASASASTSSPNRSGPMEGLSNPFSSPPSSPPPRTPGGRIKKEVVVGAHGGWRQPVGLDSPAMAPQSPSNRLYPGSAAGSVSSRIPPRTPMTPVKKRKLDYMDSPFRSPGDLMALTLESPGKSKREDVGATADVDMDGREEVKRRGKVWVGGGSPAMVKPGQGQHGRTTSFSAAKVLFSNSNDSMVRIGRRASMGTGPRLGFALPRKDRTVVEPVAVEVGEPERTAPRRAMGIEGYLADRYSDVLGRSKYPPPLPSTAASAPLVKPKPMFELGHRRRISGSATGKPASAIRGQDKYVSFLGGKKPRSSSHSLATGQRPSNLNPSTGGGPGEMAEAANVLTGMLGGSPLRRSTASPSRPPKSSKMYGRDGEELGFRIPSSRPGGGGRPRSESTERRMEMLPPIISGQVTPPRQISKLPHLRHTDGKPVGGGDTGDEDQRAAAELMIFLAQSPGSTAAGSREKRSFVHGAGPGRVLFDQRGEGDTSRDTSVVSDA